MHKFTLFLALALLFGCGKKAEDQSMPRKEDHELNTAMPEGLQGQMLDLQTEDGTPFHAYVSGLEASKPAILLIHEWWGLNEHIKSTADKFAAAGYGALAVDLYAGKVATTPDSASAYMKATNSNPELAKKKLHAALRYLNDHSTGKVATTGWCFGGGWSLQASLQDPELVNATIIYYGLLEKDPAVLKTLRGPVLGIFANEDGWITPQVVNDFENALKQAGVEYEIYRYDANHAFANPSSARYNQEAATDAWAKTLAFMGKYLR